MSFFSWPVGPYLPIRHNTVMATTLSPLEPPRMCLLRSGSFFYAAENLIKLPTIHGYKGVSKRGGYKGVLKNDSFLFSVKATSVFCFLYHRTLLRYFDGSECLSTNHVVQNVLMFFTTFPFSFLDFMALQVVSITVRRYTWRIVNRAMTRKARCYRARIVAAYSYTISRIIACI